MFLLTIQAFNLLNILVNMERALHRAPLNQYWCLIFKEGGFILQLPDPPASISRKRGTRKSSPSLFPSFLYRDTDIPSRSIETIRLVCAVLVFDDLSDARRPSIVVGRRFNRKSIAVAAATRRLEHYLDLTYGLRRAKIYLPPLRHRGRRRAPNACPYCPSLPLAAALPD